MSRIRRGARGFTLVEVLIVITIISILAAVGVPNFIKYRKRAYNAAANGDARHAYRAAQAYFVDNPEGFASLTAIKSYGFTQSKDVTVICALPQPMLIVLAFPSRGDKWYRVNYLGEIFESHF